jgi:signal peptidase I
MTTEQPRSRLSIWLLGLILGPIVLMLWLGRGYLALIYLLAQVILIGAVVLPVATGLLAPPAWGDFPTIVGLLGLLLNIIGLVHGLKIRDASVRRPWFSRWHVAIVLVVVVSWLVPFAVREFLYQPFNAPSESMVPGLLVGDYFFVSKAAYGYSRPSFTFGPGFSGRIWGGEPQRGDIVVFKLPSDNKTDYVKRLIGLPGDRIQVEDGIVHLNGEALLLTRAEGIPCREEMRCNFFRETLPGGRSYVINDTQPNGVVDNTPEYVVPPGHYFMMGDNRDNSLDSRFDGKAGGIGFVPNENLIGPAVLIFWNSMGVKVDDRLQGYPAK